MQFEVKIDQQAVEQQLVQAIMNAAIGAQVQKALTEALTKTEGPWDNRQTLVERAVSGALQDEIRRQAADIVTAKREEIRARLTEKLTDDLVDDMVSSLWEVMRGRLKQS